MCFCHPFHPFCHRAGGIVSRWFTLPVSSRFLLRHARKIRRNLCFGAAPCQLHPTSMIESARTFLLATRLTWFYESKLFETSIIPPKKITQSIRTILYQAQNGVFTGSTFGQIEVNNVDTDLSVYATVASTYPNHKRNSGSKLKVSSAIGMIQCLCMSIIYASIYFMCCLICLFVTLYWVGCYSCSHLQRRNFQIPSSLFSYTCGAKATPLKIDKYR